MCQITPSIVCSLEIRVGTVDRIVASRFNIPLDLSRKLTISRLIERVHSKPCWTSSSPCFSSPPSLRSDLRPCVRPSRRRTAEPATPIGRLGAGAAPGLARRRHWRRSRSSRHRTDCLEDAACPEINLCRKEVKEFFG